MHTCVLFKNVAQSPSPCGKTPISSEKLYLAGKTSRLTKGQMSLV